MKHKISIEIYLQAFIGDWYLSRYVGSRAAEGHLEALRGSMCETFHF